MVGEAAGPNEHSEEMMAKQIMGRTRQIMGRTKQISELTKPCHAKSSQVNKQATRIQSNIYIAIVGAVMSASCGADFDIIIIQMNGRTCAPGDMDSISTKYEDLRPQTLEPIRHGSDMWQ